MRVGKDYSYSIRNGYYQVYKRNLIEHKYNTPYSLILDLPIHSYLKNTYFKYFNKFKYV